MSEENASSDEETEFAGKENQNDSTLIFNIFEFRKTPAFVEQKKL